MSLGARLQRALGAPGGIATPRPSREPAGSEAALALRALRLDTPHGAAWVRERVIPLPSSHGAEPLGRAFERPAGHLAALLGDPRLERFDPSQALFLDIEATGLEHGAGTFAFCVGLGVREGDAFVLRQLVLFDPNDEQALLHELCRVLETRPFLVSFNGKSYDLSVLQSRLVIQRFYSARESSLKLRPHLDLLHSSRALYRGITADSRLATLERELLGVARVDDIPGHLVPSCWYDFLRTADPAPLAGVLAHNETDVLSMVSLVARLLGDSAEPAGLGTRARVNLGALWLRRRHPGAAIDALAPLLTASEDDCDTARGLELLSCAARRAGDRELAGTALDRWVGSSPGLAAARLARALFRERQRKDLGGALEDLLAARAAAPSAAVEARIQRLLGRLDARRRRGVESPPDGE